MALEIVAHRGASADAPENTLAAIHLAWEQLADATEIDVRLTGDYRIVAFHDPTTTRITGENRKVSESTFAELRELDAGLWKGPGWINERIPLLEEVLESLPPGKRLYIEIKSGQRIVPVLASLLSTHPAAERVVLIGYRFDVLQGVKELVPQVPVYQILRLAITPKSIQETSPDLDDWLLRLKEAKFEGLDLGITKLLTLATVQRILAEKLRLCTWTINEAQEALRLESIGVEAITTDYPAGIRHALTAGDPHFQPTVSPV